MKFKVARSLLVLSLALILVIGGTTVAWFTAEYKMPSAAELIMGTLSFKITNTEVCSTTKGARLAEAGDTFAWDADECKEFSWTIENTGSKTAFFRARPEAGFTGSGEPEKEATAWGEGNDFSGGNWAMYFEYQGGEKQVILKGKQKGENRKETFDAGMITVKPGENDKVIITIQTKDGWKMLDSHVHLAKTPDNFPIGGGGNPNPGKFAYKKHYLSASCTYEIESCKFYDTTLIAVHACLTKGEGEETTQKNIINWSLPDGSAWEAGLDDGWFYHCQPVENGEEITLELEGCLDVDAGNGSCTVWLEAEAVQATHGAASAEWGSINPCSSQ